MHPSLRPRHPFSAGRIAGLGSLLLALLSFGASGGVVLEGDARKRALTDRRVETLGRAIVRYYEDMRVWPDAFNKLVTRPSGATKWAGSYLPVRFSSLDDLRDRTVRDGWGRKMTLHYGGYDAHLFSSGSDGVAAEGGGDDRGQWLNADQALWKETKREVRVLNAMIAAYQANESHKLPPSFEGAYNNMRSRGYLPSTTPAWKRDYWRDAWGSKYDATTGGHPNTIVKAYSKGRP